MTHGVDLYIVINLSIYFVDIFFFKKSLLFQQDIRLKTALIHSASFQKNRLQCYASRVN